MGTVANIFSDVASHQSKLREGYTVQGIGIRRKRKVQEFCVEGHVELLVFYCKSPKLLRIVRKHASELGSSGPLCQHHLEVAGK